MDRGRGKDRDRVRQGAGVGTGTRKIIKKHISANAKTMPYKFKGKKTKYYYGSLNQATRQGGIALLDREGKTGKSAGGRRRSGEGGYLTCAFEFSRSMTA